MSTIILKAENISKQYRLGLVGSRTLRDDLKRIWYHARGKENPFLKVGETNDRSKKGKGDYVWALRDINFELQQGEVLGIIGKNGAGKSTLLKILSRVTAPTTGTIKSRGRIASLLEVGTGFNPELTGRENIFLNGAILGMTKAEIRTKFDEIVAFSGCERYIDTPTKRYSSGMTVRLAFAVAAHLEPEILVVDEVLAVGDAEFQKKAIGKMQDISKGEGRTVLFVSHNMASIQSLCTRAILLENGKLLEDGPVRMIIDQYLSHNATFKGKDLIKEINVEERTGTGLIKIKNVELVPGTKALPTTGAPLTIVFNFDNPQKIPFKNINFDFRIDDQIGQRLLWLSTSTSNMMSEEVAERVSFHFKKLPLNSGNYQVTLHLAAKNEIADWAKNAFQFQVEEGFFYENMKSVAIEQSKVLVDYKLTVND
ncbi:ABC transporter ATP-binding protein [Leeuwenhoekiella sp. A2]|uniref:ABC transporter ATP-binding protein n=1 Tax=Leeuwenhoekiella sp. A2 TaxID=3141460 RepID=UPI003A80E4C8